MSALADFHFLRPLALLLLLALPLAGFAWRRARRDAGAWRAAVDAQLLPYLIERVAQPGARGALVLASLAWMLACVALAGPAWEREATSLHRDHNARVLALELAPSMLAQDERPSRLERARYKIADILERSRDRQTALVAYAGEAFVVAPLTDDVGTVQNLVGALDPSTMPVAGNDTADAIRRAVELARQAGFDRGEIVLIADSVGPGAASAARRARDAGLRVSVLGVGSPAGAPIPLAQGDFLKDERGEVVLARLDESALRALADAGGGRYAHVTADATDLDALLGDARASIAGARDADPSAQGAEGHRWRDRGPWLLLLLVPLVLAGFRRGWLMVLPLACVLATPRADAGVLEDLWARRDQQAAAALREGDAARATEVAPSAAWSGAAAYRAGDFAAAAQHYADAPGADAAYNRGNALAQAKQYEQALAAYDEALRLDPAMEDAKANRAAVEAFLEQQPKPPPGGGQRKDPSDENRPSDSRSGQRPESGEDASPSDQREPQSGQEEKAEGEQADAPSDAPSGDSGDQREGERDPAASEESAASAETRAGADEKQREALSRSIDEALQQPADAPAQPGDAKAPAEDEATRERRQALEHWLRRVPDDPGGLLRRKFQLEHQRRRQDGEGP
ncbi:MAG: VWA domain-containing protein [Lysobacteraceae bacterium]|nr:MAG: VWA domain-containing protein [Xanthomonadaceae bacterium]